MPNTFRYERSLVIAATEARLAPEIFDLRRHALWSPFAEPDARRRDIVTGEAGVGQTLAFEGGRSGAGRIRVDAVEPGRIVMTLTMLKPMKAVNRVEYLFQPEAGGLRVTWAMSGPMTFLGRIFNLFVDCEAMCGGMFEKGLAALKTLVEREALLPRAEAV